MAIDTRDRILDVAERMFGERGFPATSLRDITTEAGVNVASVNYHFGSKEALLAEVLERRLKPINERRLELLDAVEAQAGDGPPELEAVVRAFLSPPFHSQRVWGEKGPGFLRLVGRIHSETNEEFRATFVKQFRRRVPALHGRPAAGAAGSRRRGRELADAVHGGVDGVHDVLGTDAGGARVRRRTRSGGRAGVARAVRGGGHGGARAGERTRHGRHRTLRVTCSC